MCPFFCLLCPRTPSSPLFPYTTLFRSRRRTVRRQSVLRGGGVRPGRARRADRQGSLDHEGRGQQECVLHVARAARSQRRSEEHTSELQSLRHLVCRLLLEKKKTTRVKTVVKEMKKITHLVKEKRVGRQIEFPNHDSVIDNDYSFTQSWIIEWKVDAVTNRT